MTSSPLERVGLPAVIMPSGTIQDCITMEFFYIHIIQSAPDDGAVSQFRGLGGTSTIETPPNTSTGGRVP